MKNLHTPGIKKILPIAQGVVPFQQRGPGVYLQIAITQGVVPPDLVWKVTPRKGWYPFYGEKSAAGKGWHGYGSPLKAKKGDAQRVLPMAKKVEKLSENLLTFHRFGGILKAQQR